MAGNYAYVVIAGVGYLCAVIDSKLAMSNLTVRVLVAIVGIPLVVAVIVTGGWLLAVFCALVSALGAGELYHMARAKGTVALTPIGIATAALIPLAMYAGGSAAIPPLMVAACLVVLMLQLVRGIHGAISTLGVTALGMLYPALLLVWLIPLRQWNPASELDGAWLVLALVTGIWICDTAAYFVGRAIGRRRLAPTVSPKKTWEGALAGGAASILWCTAVVPAVLAWGTPWLGAAIGAIIGSVGQIGDLAESVLKRDAGVKDSSAIIPGHGGVLDRFDSVIATAPVVYGLLVVLQWFSLVP